MTERDLKRRISDALLAGGLEKDAGLAEALAADPEAAAYARDLEKMDGLLRGWPQADKSDDSWEALAARVDQRMKDPLRAPGDMTLPPRFDDDDPFVREPRGAAVRAGISPPRPATQSPLKAPVGEKKPFTPLKPGAVRPAAPAAAPPAAAKPVEAKPVEAKPVLPAPEPAKPAEVEVDVAEAAAPSAPELAPPPPGATPEPVVEAAAAQSAEPITVSEPPSPISLPPSALEDAPRESLPELVPRESSGEISLANLSNLDVKHQTPPPVPAAAHAKPPPTPVKALPPKKDDRADIPSAAQPFFELPIFDAPVTAPQAPKKKSRAPVYGMLAIAATLALAFGGWVAINQGGLSDQEQLAYGPPSGTAAPSPVAASTPTDTAAEARDPMGGAPLRPTMPPPAQQGVAIPAATPAAPLQLAQGEGGQPTTGVLDQAARGGGAGMYADGHLDDNAADTEAGDEGGGETVRHHAHRPGGGLTGPIHIGGTGHAAPPPPPTGGGGGGAVAANTAHDSATTHHAHGGGGGSDSPPRDDVVNAMGTVRAAVVACAAGRGGVAWVQVTFAGPTGRVSNALVQGTFAGTPQGSCIARAVRGASVPPFHNPSFTVAYPFQL